MRQGGTTARQSVAIACGNNVPAQQFCMQARWQALRTSVAHTTSPLYKHKSRENKKKSTQVNIVHLRRYDYKLCR